MIIALDYDNTFTADRLLWGKFLEDCKARDYVVYIVTARSEEFDQIDDPILQEYINSDYIEAIIYCDGMAKKDVMNHANIYVSIWIDDQPAAIIQGSAYTIEMLAEWRASGRQ